MAKAKIEVIARGVLSWRDQILVCREIEHGYVYLPGGKVEPGEPATEALAREFEEETGLTFRGGACLAVAEVLFEQGGRPRHEVNVVFHVEPPTTWSAADTPPTVPSLEDHIAFEWLPIAALPDTDFRPNALRAWLATDAMTDTDRTASQQGAAHTARIIWISHRET